jgi:peptide methionine sulfoxide reductase MsrB
MRTLSVLFHIIPSIAAWSNTDLSRRAFLQSSGAAVVLATTAPVNAVGGQIRYGDESIMVQKEHGTSAAPVQSDLLYGVDNQLADRICNYNRRFAELGGYFQKTSFENTVLNAQGPITFYDSVTGKPLFVAPIHRSAEDFVNESRKHGWPSFRDDEVVWENVRVLRSSGETVSLDGTHLGHNLPDSKGNRYCINLVSIAGKPTEFV